MRYCVIKDSTTIIDGSNSTLEIMLKNALSAGFSESGVEILTEEEYRARKASEPIQPKELTEIEQIRLDVARGNAELFETMIMLSGGGF